MLKYEFHTLHETQLMPRRYGRKFRLLSKGHNGKYFHSQDIEHCSDTSHALLTLLFKSELDGFRIVSGLLPDASHHALSEHWYSDLAMPFPVFSMRGAYILSEESEQLTLAFRHAPDISRFGPNSLQNGGLTGRDDIVDWRTEYKALAVELD